MAINIDKGRYWDLPWSLVSGCTRVSPGCQNCWALAMEKRFHKGIEGKIITHEDRLDIPLKRRKSTVYAVWNDLFHKDVPNGFIRKAYQTMFDCHHHTFLILTKRAGRMADYFEKTSMMAINVWHGLTVCNQQEADEKIPVFLQAPGNKFLSIEPMLGHISLRWLAAWDSGAMKPRKWGQSTNKYNGLRPIDAVILGGETGPGARPMHPGWVRSIKDQCAAVGVPFFFKSGGSKWEPEQRRLLDGRTHDALPWAKG